MGVQGLWFDFDGPIGESINVLKLYRNLTGQAEVWAQTRGDTERWFEVSNNHSGEDVLMADLFKGSSTLSEPVIHTI